MPYWLQPKRKRTCQLQSLLARYGGNYFFLPLFFFFFLDQTISSHFFFFIFLNFFSPFFQESTRARQIQRSAKNVRAVNSTPSFHKCSVLIVRADTTNRANKVRPVCPACLAQLLSAMDPRPVLSVLLVFSFHTSVQTPLARHAQPASRCPLKACRSAESVTLVSLKAQQLARRALDALDTFTPTLSTLVLGMTARLVRLATSSRATMVSSASYVRQESRV